jgi:hypothetical protein
MARFVGGSAPSSPTISAGPELRLSGTPDAGAIQPVQYVPGWPRAPTRPKRERDGLWVAITVVVVLAIVIIVGLAVLVSFVGNERFTCPGVAWTVHYVGSGSGYFGANPQTGCLGYPVTGATGYEITVILTLTNTATSTSHQVSSITLATPSTMNSISPSLPITLTAGGTANITLNVTIPTLTGDYVIAGAITTA